MDSWAGSCTGSSRRRSRRRCRCNHPNHPKDPNYSRSRKYGSASGTRPDSARRTDCRCRSCPARSQSGPCTTPNWTTCPSRSCRCKSASDFAYRYCSYRSLPRLFRPDRERRRHRPCSRPSAPAAPRAAGVHCRSAFGCPSGNGRRLRFRLAGARRAAIAPVAFPNAPAPQEQVVEQLRLCLREPEPQLPHASVWLSFALGVPPASRCTRPRAQSLQAQLASQRACGSALRRKAATFGSDWRPSRAHTFATAHVTVPLARLQAGARQRAAFSALAARSFAPGCMPLRRCSHRCIPTCPDCILAAFFRNFRSQRARVSPALHEHSWGRVAGRPGAITQCSTPIAQALWQSRSAVIPTSASGRRSRWPAAGRHPRRRQRAARCIRHRDTAALRAGPSVQPPAIAVFGAVASHRLASPRAHRSCAGRATCRRRAAGAVPSRASRRNDAQVVDAAQHLTAEQQRDDTEASANGGQRRRASRAVGSHQNAPVRARLPSPTLASSPRRSRIFPFSSAICGQKTAKRRRPKRRCQRRRRRSRCWRTSWRHQCRAAPWACRHCRRSAARPAGQRQRIDTRRAACGNARRRHAQAHHSNVCLPAFALASTAPAVGRAPAGLPGVPQARVRRRITTCIACPSANLTSRLTSGKPLPFRQPVARPDSPPGSRQCAPLRSADRPSDLGSRASGSP